MMGLTVEPGIVVGIELGTDVGRLNDPLTAGAVVGV